MITNKSERVKMVRAMEFIARQVNSEDVFEDWLMNGVADGAIIYGHLDGSCHELEDYLEYYVDDEHFGELMGLFLRIMSRAKKDGGLYCGGVVSKN